MTCPVDAIAWGEKNRVTLVTGKTHEWVLARTTRDAPTLASVPVTARAVMGKWFDGTPLDVLFADAGTAVDAITVLGVTDQAPSPRAKDQRRESLDPIPLLASSKTPPLYVTVRFNYRGYAKSLPWPVWTATGSLFREDKLCPLDADWMLVLSRDAAALPDVPEEASFLTKLEDNAPGGLSSLASLTKLAGWALGIYVGIQVLGLARTVLPAPRKRAA